jgi:hypothetical protein
MAAGRSPGAPDWGRGLPEWRGHSGKRADFAGINVFTVGEDGLISRLEGYWDYAAMVAQIR